ncbi:unnamed protein product [Cuscuta epithymum]|uniref:Uncharacterized protein n=1 Tax=Cuscuta epithymum TaxID=186058 RepID=A0AAV0C5A6_9ASTE|nr:unnamed protein product [Cuscuta epithymum]
MDLEGERSTAFGERNHSLRILRRNFNSHFIRSKEAGEVKRTTAVRNTGDRAGMPLSEELIDDVSGERVIEVSVGEAHLPARPGGAHRRPEYDSVHGGMREQFPQNHLQMHRLFLRAEFPARIGFGDPNRDP